MTRPSYTGQVHLEDDGPLEKALDTPAPGEDEFVPTEESDGVEQAVRESPESDNSVAEGAAPADPTPNTEAGPVDPPLPAVTQQGRATPTLGNNMPKLSQHMSVQSVNQDPAYLAELLPKKKTAVKTDFSGSIVLIYGPPKIGKSDLASQFPTPMFITTEEGHDHLHIFLKSVAVWVDYLEIVQALITYHDKVPYKTIVIDTVDLLFDYCNHHYCIEKGITHPSDEGFGKGWDGLRLEWQRGIQTLTKLGFTIVFISHAKQRQVTMHGIERDVIMPSMSNTAARVIKPAIDYIIYLDYCSLDESKDGRKMVLRGDSTVEAGDRSGLFTPTLYEITYDALIRDFRENVVPGLQAKFGLTPKEGDNG